MNGELVAFLGPTVFLAYAVFGLTGFGAAMVAVPIMVQFVPLMFAVPLVLLFDLLCTSWVGARNWRHVSTAELRRMFPTMLMGIVVGTTVLSGLGPKWPLVSLGTFVLLVSARNLVGSSGGAINRFDGRWAMPFGLIGGVFSALFGTGGPIYTIYLSRRLPDLKQFRATISVIILSSGIIRVVAFGMAGLYAKDSILLTALGLLPFCLAGLYIGSRLSTCVAPERVKKWTFVLLAAAGAGVLYRGIVSG